MKVVAHRGASVVAPENTMAAFGEASRLGADGIEFDVQPTADGQLAVVHDAMLDRTTNGRGAVFEASWQDLEHLDAGSWFSPQHAGERIPRLSDVLALPDLEFELELKGYGDGFLDDVLAAVDTAGVIDRVEFTSWNLPLLSILQRRMPTACTGLFTRPRERWMNDSVFEHHVVGMGETSGSLVVHVYAADVTERIVERLHALGKQVHANDAVSADDMVRAHATGVDRLSADDVAVAVGVRRNAELRNR